MGVSVPDGWYVELSENNSGGRWWLTDSDWQGLEDAGWVVDWAALEAQSATVQASGLGIQKDSKGVWRDMGALARKARRYGVSKLVAAAEFEDVTGQHPDAAGCTCCGPPHNFTMHGEDESFGEPIRGRV